MKDRFRLCAVLALAWALPLGCGGGGGAPGGPTAALPQQTAVVQMDENGDDEPDLLTLDISETPFRIVEALRGVPGGDPIDVTDLLRGQAIDIEISGALSDYLAGSFGVAQRVELDVNDEKGLPVRVVVFE